MSTSRSYGLGRAPARLVDWRLVGFRRASPLGIGCSALELRALRFTDVVHRCGGRHPFRALIVKSFLGMRPILIKAAVGLTLICILFGIALIHSSRDPAAITANPGGLLGELARARMSRMIAPRLSIPTEHRPCSLRAPADGTIPQASCEAAAVATVPSRRILDLSTRAFAAVQAKVDPEALHAVALIDLLWSENA